MNHKPKVKQSFRQIASNQWFIMKLCFRTAPFLVYHLVFIAIMGQLSVFFEHTIGIRYVLNTAETGGPFLQALLYLVFVSVFIETITLCYQFYGQRVSLRQKPKLYKALKEQLYHKARELDLSCYDDPAYYNDFVLTVSEAEKSLDRFLDMINNAVSGITRFVSTGIFIFALDKAGLLFVLVSFALSFTGAQLMNRLKYKIRILKNPIERRRAYNHRLFYLNEYAKELRLNPSIKDILYEDFNKTNDEIYDIDKNHVRKLCGLGFFTNYLSRDFITTGLFSVYLVYRTAVLHLISYSSMVVLFNTINQCRRSLYTLAELFPMISENSLYIGKIRAFLLIEPKIKSGNIKELPDGPKTLELQNVSFAYNDKGGNILKNISMVVCPHEKIALVGYNGAGKTTLIKLIMRLYDTNEGDIYYDNVNIKEYDINAYRNRIGAVFQDYKIYAATLKENVVLDYYDQNVDITSDTHTQALQEKAMDEQIIASLQKSGFGERLAVLKDGLNTPLSTEFEENGINLSGGESQKIAIARAFYENSNLIILDEPSSALDPISEYHLNKTMQNVAKNKSVIYISHRLSTTRDADRIYMLEAGSIIESGTHRELLELNGKYAAMWNAQAGRYR